MLQRTFALSLLAGTLLTIAACNTDPSKDKTKVVASDPAAAPIAPKSATRYTFSQADSKLAFVGAKVTGKHDGGFGTFTGKIDAVDGDATKSLVTVEADAASITTDTPKLTGHLKSADFFDVGKYPTVKFVSTSIKAGGEGGATHTVTGNLELHGVTKSISFPATIKLAGESVDVDAEFSINRKDFGVVYAGMPDDLIRDQVLIKLSVRARRAAA